jgi:acyl dehydratase
MTATLSYDDVEVGAQLPASTFPIGRADLVRYAGASGDFNPIHWSPSFAESVGLPGVIAHGMLTMATAGRLVSDWAGDPGAVVEYGVRFTKPVVVPDDIVGDASALVEVSGKVLEKLDGRRVKVELTARAGEDKVLGMARAVVQLA